MDAGKTPLQQLDDAIESYLRSLPTAVDGAFVTGWAVSISTARVQADDDDALPMVTGMQYSFGPQTSVAQLGGLAQFLSVVAERAMWGMLNAADDD